MTRSPARAVPTGWLVGGFVAVVGAGLVALLVGPVDLGVSAILSEVANLFPGVSIDAGMSELHHSILFDVRMPRLVLGLLVGGVLAMSGGAYQGIFRNPLADPWLLGVAAGAGLGATAAIVFGGVGSSLLPLAAFGGAVLAVAITYGLGYSSQGRSALTLVLSGVAVGSFLTALQTFLQIRNTDVLREVFSWILGGLTTASWTEVGLILPYVVVSLAVVMVHGRQLDVLSVGDEEAATLGVNVGQTRLIVIAAATLGAAAVVSVSGLIGFVGIIVPHTIRLLVGNSYRAILPLSFLGGGAFLVLADVLAKTLSAPAELPIGVVTAFFGAPFFWLILHRFRTMTP